MQKTHITAYDYGHSRCQAKEVPVKYVVDAWCVAGDTGIRAYFLWEGMVYEAHGDDGHWWVVGHFSPYWLRELKDTLHSVIIGTICGIPLCKNVISEGTRGMCNEHWACYGDEPNAEELVLTPEEEALVALYTDEDLEDE